MIKKFKIFENNELKYKVNDYVYVYAGSNYYYKYCKIKMVNDKPGNRSWDYKAYVYVEDVGFYISYVEEYDITRKMTDQEIEEFEIREKLITYNL